jgi:hypothetical protein
MKPLNSQHVVANENRNFQTENARMYNDKGYQVRQSKAPKRSALANSLPFEGQSMYRATFQPKELPPPCPAATVDRGVPPSDSGHLFYQDQANNPDPRFQKWASVAN